MLDGASAIPRIRAVRIDVIGKSGTGNQKEIRKEAGVRSPIARSILIQRDGSVRRTETEQFGEFRGQCGLARLRILAGGSPVRVIASHEPGIEPCGAAGNRRVDA